MELKDVILSTIAELGEEPEAAEKGEPSTAGKGDVAADRDQEPGKVEKVMQPEKVTKAAVDEEHILQEREFLENLKERILVLFEGFQSPNNKRVEAKIDLTLNFLEYILALLDERIDTLKKG